jgi:hypothetical protein
LAAIASGDDDANAVRLTERPVSLLAIVQRRAERGPERQSTP